ncbi:DUF2764 domain-containing protein [Omnitrophica bacterium]|nr:DUF2764 domain-containing protein [Candidatus Omnitrophota bacterium]
MSKKYYYLVASLPYLRFEGAPPIMGEEFLSECGKWLDPENLGKLASIDINDFAIRRGDDEVIREWKSFDLTLREELAKIRQTWREGGRERIPIFFKDVFEERTPLLMEKRIQKKRWDFLEEKEFGYHFDANVLSLYFLKLQILERLAAFEKEKGKGVFEGLCEVTYE